MRSTLFVPGVFSNHVRLQQILSMTSFEACVSTKCDGVYVNLSLECVKGHALKNS